MLIRLGFMSSSFVSFEKNHTVSLQTMRREKKTHTSIKDIGYECTSFGLSKYIGLTDEQLKAGRVQLCLEIYIILIYVRV